MNKFFKLLLFILYCSLLEANINPTDKKIQNNDSKSKKSKIFDFLESGGINNKMDQNREEAKVSVPYSTSLDPGIKVNPSNTSTTDFYNPGKKVNPFNTSTTDFSDSGIKVNFSDSDIKVNPSDSDIKAIPLK